jgi:hypothetical protein
MSSTPIYLDWVFWSVFVAILALVLSQLPPLHVIFSKAHLSCEAFSRMLITHKIGNPNAQWHLIIENTGGRSIRIKEITLGFSKDGGIKFEIPAQAYLWTSSSPDSIMLTPFRLAPGEEWAHIINFFGLFSREDEKEYRRLESAIRLDIRQQKEQPANREIMCEADSAIVKETVNFFNKHFKWSPGEYDLELKVVTDRSEVNICRTYRFSLFESESKELFDYSEMYRFGDGVFFQSEKQRGIIVPVQKK